MNSLTYRRGDPLAFLESQRWPIKRQGRELVTTCPFCEKAGHFYMHAESGLWKCHRCSEAGNLWQLCKRLGLDNGSNAFQSFGQALGAKLKRIPLQRVETLHTALLADQEAVEYCTKARRWELAVVKRCKIGLRVDGRGKWITYPWFCHGECVGMKYRILPAYQTNFPGRFEREPNCESVLFNGDVLGSHEEIILASGESDALALLTLGYENVVATTTGETSLPAVAVDALGQKVKVLIPFDNDATGQKGAREIGKRIGLERTWLVSLPTGMKDVNEFVVRGGTRETFEGLLAKAVQFDIPSVFSLGQALDRLEQEKTLGSSDELAEMTPWPSVNRRVGQWRPGNLIVVSGPQGTGKTSWMLQVAAFWAAQGFPALVYCLEMAVEELVQHVLCQRYHLPEKEVTPPIIDQARQELAEWPLYFGADPRITGREEVLGLLSQAVRRYGLRLLGFDNLHMLARSIEHRNEEVGVLTKSFKSLAMEHEIPLVLIAQPRKLQLGHVMTPYDLKDSVDIYSDADQVILLHRELVGATRDAEAVMAAEAGESDNLSPITLIRLAKARHMASKDTVLFCEGAQHRFREIEPGE